MPHLSLRIPTRSMPTLTPHWVRCVAMTSVEAPNYSATLRAYVHNEASALRARQRALRYHVNTVDRN